MRLWMVFSWALSVASSIPLAPFWDLTLAVSLREDPHPLPAPLSFSDHSFGLNAFNISCPSVQDLLKDLLRARGLPLDSQPQTYDVRCFRGSCLVPLLRKAQAVRKRRDGHETADQVLQIVKDMCAVDAELKQCLDTTADSVLPAGASCLTPIFANSAMYKVQRAEMEFYCQQSTWTAMKLALPLARQCIAQARHSPDMPFCICKRNVTAAYELAELIPGALTKKDRCEPYRHQRDALDCMEEVMLSIPPCVVSEKPAFETLRREFSALGDRAGCPVCLLCEPTAAPPPSVLLSTAAAIIAALVVAAVLGTVFAAWACCSSKSNRQLRHRLRTVTADSNFMRELDPKSIKVEGELGQGHFGIVLKGTLSSISGVSNDVAIKKVHEEDNCTDAKMADFKLEIQRWLDLGSHENIVKAMGAVTTTGRPMLVLELCEGGTLGHFVKEREPDAVEVFGLAENVAFGLVYLVSMKIVHRFLLYYRVSFVRGEDSGLRDLAPRNVLVARRGNREVAKIGDFGLARSVAGDEELQYRPTAERRLPIWICPPECLEGGAAGFASDVWSFGVLLWELAGGCQDEPYATQRRRQRRPDVPEEDPQTWLTDFLRQGNRLELPDDQVRCPQALADLVQKCWEAKSEDRPSAQAAQAVLAGLRRRPPLPTDATPLRADGYGTRAPFNATPLDLDHSSHSSAS